MEAQEALDRMAKGLMRQGRKSEGRTLDVNGKLDAKPSCRFRGDSGCMCAVGFLIPKKLYTENMELESYADLTCFKGWPEDTINVMGLMQCVHDNTQVRDWAAGIRQAAKEADLECPEVVK